MVNIGVTMSGSFSSTDKSQKNEYRIRFDGSGKVLGESIHSGLGTKIGIALDKGYNSLSIFEYIERLSILDANLPDRLRPRIEELLKSHREFSCHGDYKVGDETYHLHISCRGVRYYNEDVFFTLLFLDDTSHTNLRRMYEYMFRLANHELKGPLACIIGAVEYAESHLSDNNLAGVITCIEMIERNADAIEDMITRYLNLSRIESGSFAIRPADIIVSVDVLNSLLTELKHGLRSRKMSFHFECPDIDHEPYILADAEKLTIVLRNLLSNAVKYGKACTVIKVTLCRRNDLVEIAVENEGKNIPQNALNKLFEKFVRLEATQGTKGSGLGLYNARKIIELWGGEINVDSSENRTCFTFTIPQEPAKSD